MLGSLRPPKVYPLLDLSAGAKIPQLALKFFPLKYTKPRSQKTESQVSEAYFVNCVTFDEPFTYTSNYINEIKLGILKTYLPLLCNLK